MATTKKATKEVQIVATYYHKKDGKFTGVVTYLVKSSDGKSEYCTTLVDAKATGCSCAARGNCYHKKQLEAKAVARQEVATKFAAKHAPSWFVELVAKGIVLAPKQVVVMPAQEQVPPIAMELPAELKGYRKTAVSSDLKGNLNGAQQSAAFLMALPSRRKTA